jgi:hypothetical protein
MRLAEKLDRKGLNIYVMLFSSRFNFNMDFQAETQLRDLCLELRYVKSTRTTVKNRKSLEEGRQWHGYFKVM